MTTLFTICAIAGGTLFLCQLLLGMLGIGGDQDADHPDAGADHGHESGDHFVNLLSFRALAAALTFFGICGLTAANYQIGAALCALIAVASGVGAMFIVASAMRFLYKLQSDGTLHIEQALGKTGTVYLSIPGNKSGAGKVTLTVQNRLVEFQAQTARGDLPTGTKVVVVDILGPDSVEVAAESEADALPSAVAAPGEKSPADEGPEKRAPQRDRTRG